jgi:hypothetical protein
MYLLKSFLSLKMFIDPQSDVYAQYLQRKGDTEFPYRVAWEFQEQVRQHLLKTHAPDIINTTAFMNAPPSKFPQWTTPDLEERTKTSGYEVMENGEAPQYRNMQDFEPDEYEYEYVDEDGKPIEKKPEEQKQPPATPNAQTTTDPQNIQKETETQHNDTPKLELSKSEPQETQSQFSVPVTAPSTTLKLEAPKSEPIPINLMAQEAQTQYNVPATSKEVPPQTTQEAPPRKRRERSYLNPRRYYRGKFPDEDKH